MSTSASPIKRVRRLASACLRPCISMAARAYVAGEKLEDALRVCRRHKERGFSATVGYFNLDDEPAGTVSEQYAAVVAALAQSGDYMSIKLPALRDSQPALARLCAAAKAAGVRVHFDAMWPESAGATRDVVDALVRQDACQVGYTLPGRWARSLPDADWVAERQIPVRVVKGQWSDGTVPERDLRAGFVEVVSRLAGRARHVAVACHDPPVVRESLARLQAAGTSCELELLFGLPTRECIAIARARGVGVRMYVPYGAGYLNYAVERAYRNPRLVWWLIRDMAATATRRRG